MSATLCKHGNQPKKCSKCKREHEKAQRKEQKKTDRAAAKRAKKSARRQARYDKSKISRIKNAAKDMTSIHDEKGRSRMGNRYRDDGSKIWPWDKDA